MGLLAPRLYRPSVPKAWESSLVGCQVPPLPPVVLIITLADFCYPNRTSTIAHLLSIIYISLFPWDSARPSSQTSLPCEEAVTATMHASPSFPRPRSAFTSSKPLEASVTGVSSGTNNSSPHLLSTYYLPQGQSFCMLYLI